MSKRFQQSDFWCDFKCAHGWKKINHNNINILLRSFKKGPVSFSLAYVPMAPEFVSSSVPGFEEQAVNEVEYLKKCSEFAQSVKNQLPSDTMCMRFDFPVDMPTVEVRDDYLFRFPQLADFAKVNIKKSSVDVQPPDTTILQLDKTEKELLDQMKSKWRYNIGYAKKHGIEVRAVTADSDTFQEDLDSFYSLYKTTASRDGIGIHPKSYYEDLLKRGAPSAQTGFSSDNPEKQNHNESLITLYIGSHEGQDLAAIITLFQKDEAVYLYGCSGNEKRRLMPTYLVQWTAICDARNFGSKIYDFYGIPPTGDDNHPMHGLYLFKTGFGGPEIHRPGSFDIPLTGFYRFYTAAEKLRAFWHKKVMKKIRGR